jgi:hypothetical protein
MRPLGPQPEFLHRGLRRLVPSSALTCTNAGDLAGFVA